MSCTLRIFMFFPLFTLKEFDMFFSAVGLLSMMMSDASFLNSGPYLQGVSDHQASILFETETTSHCNVEYEDKMVATEIIHQTYGDLSLFKATLDSLESDTFYNYRVHCRKDETVTVGDWHELRTFPPSGEQENFSFLMSSDAQSGYQATFQTVRKSMMPRLQQWKEDDFPVRFMLFAGDLVQHGRQHHRWRQDFFFPMAPLLAEIPLFPAIGNHEENDALYFKYFQLPANGSSKEDLAEHWYYFDHGAVRFITLDTNKEYRTQEQLDWLKQLLEKTNEQKKSIDFVVVQFHHPYLSELWVKGNTEYSGEIQQKLEQFSNESGIPSISLFGHTHGYSRGHSFSARHTMINVGSIGGRLDQWGKYEQKDYPEYVMSLDHYGWLRATVMKGKGEESSIKFQRFNYGQRDNQWDEGIVDEFIIRKNSHPPVRPTVKLVNRKEVEISPFIDEDGDELLSVHLQVSLDESFVDEESLLVNKMMNKVNIFHNADLNEHLDLSKIAVEVPLKAYVRVRYRDSSLHYSEWSEVQ